MSEYFSSREGLQRVMEWSLNGPPEEAAEYGKATATPDFYHIVNGKRNDYDSWLKDIAQWRGKISDYKPQMFVKRKILQEICTNARIQSGVSP